LIDEFVKANPALRCYHTFNKITGPLLELVEARQRDIGRDVYNSMREYFEEMTSFITRSTRQRSGLWGDELRSRILEESSKEFYAVVAGVAEEEEEWDLEL